MRAEQRLYGVSELFVLAGELSHAQAHVCVLGGGRGNSFLELADTYACVM